MPKTPKPHDDDIDLDGLPIVWGEPPVVQTTRKMTPVQRKLQHYAEVARQHPGQTLRVDPDKVFGGPITSNRASYWRSHDVLAGLVVNHTQGVLYLTAPVPERPAKKAAAKKAAKRVVRRGSAQGEAAARRA